MTKERKSTLGKLRASYKSGTKKGRNTHFTSAKYTQMRTAKPNVLFAYVPYKTLSLIRFKLPMFFSTTFVPLHKIRTEFAFHNI